MERALGYIYCITGDYYNENNLYKIGMTTKDKRRVLYRYRNTLVNPTILSWKRVSDVRSAESEIHEILTDIGFHHQNELFMGDIKKISSVIDEVCQKHLVDDDNISHRFELQKKNAKAKMVKDFVESSRQNESNLFGMFAFTNGNMLV